MDRSVFRYALRSCLIGYLLVLIVLPISVIYMKGFSLGWDAFIYEIFDDIAYETIVLTVKLGVLTTIIQLFVGTIVAYTLVRYRFVGRGILNSLVDLPFALPTAVSGVILLTMFSPNSPMGSFLKSIHVELLFNEYAIVIGMFFVTFPFVVRAVQPLLEQINTEEEEASLLLGASPGTTFRRVILPVILPGILSGGMLALSRALAEFGVIALISGNLPMETLVSSVYIFSEIESFNPVAASAVSILLLTLSFLILWMVHFIQRRGARYV